MKIAIIDADLVGRKKHRFPNLACMKISAYHKSKGDEVVLKMDYENLDFFDKTYISKVFTDTAVPDDVLNMKNVNYGGTGFYYDKAPCLPDYIEHIMPDYHLYDAWVYEKIKNGAKERDFICYRDYSIGFLTRGCFRKCDFCVNRNHDRVSIHSPLAEFHAPTRSKICLLDDNFFGTPHWKDLLQELKVLNKPFQFKQGLDERLLTDEKCEALFSSKYDGDYIFAFDNLADAELIESKIKLARKYTNAVMKFYCFCGFDRNNHWDTEFWKQDVFELLQRVEILMRNRCIPYVMRFMKYTESPYRGVYITIARWCNQPSFYKKKSLREFAICNGINSSCYKYLEEFERMYPEAGYYFDLKYEELNKI